MPRTWFPDGFPKTSTPTTRTRKSKRFRAISKEPSSRPLSTRLLSEEAVKRIVRAAGGRRVGSYLLAPVDGVNAGTRRLVGDRYGVVHSIFREAFDTIALQSLDVMRGQRLKTLMGRHVQKAASILGEVDRKTLPVKIAMAPLRRRLQKTRVRLRLSETALLQLLAAISLDQTICWPWLRSTAGLTSYDNDRKTIESRDVKNTATICSTFPR